MFQFFLWKWGQAVFLLFPSAVLPFWFISATVHTIQIDKHLKLLSAFKFSPLIKYKKLIQVLRKNIQIPDGNEIETRADSNVT